jgi:hypothetical protein
LSFVGLRSCGLRGNFSSRFNDGRERSKGARSPSTRGSVVVVRGELEGLEEEDVLETKGRG